MGFPKLSRNPDTVGEGRSVKARIHCEIFLSEHFMKYVFDNTFIV